MTLPTLPGADFANTVVSGVEIRGPALIRLYDAAGNLVRVVDPRGYDLVRETADLVRGSRFHLIRGAGHLPCVEKPVEYAQTLAAFLAEIGHA